MDTRVGLGLSISNHGIGDVSLRHFLSVIPQLRMVNPYGKYVTQGPAAGALIHQP
jgi:hypothetical protein